MALGIVLLVLCWVQNHGRGLRAWFWLSGCSLCCEQILRNQGICASRYVGYFRKLSVFF